MTQPTHKDDIKDGSHSDENLEKIDKALRLFVDTFANSLEGLSKDLNEYFARIELQFLLLRKKHRQHMHTINMRRRMLLIRGERKRKECRIVHSYNNAKKDNRP